MRRRAFLGLVAGVAVAVTRVEASLWIESVSDNGEILILSDDSAWEVEFTDQIKSQLWLAMQRVAVAKTSTSGLYRIVRERQGDSVRARLLRRS